MGGEGREAGRGEEDGVERSRKRRRGWSGGKQEGTGRHVI